MSPSLPSRLARIILATLGVTAAALLLLDVLAAAPVGAARPAQATSGTRFLPDLQSKGYTTATIPSAADVAPSHGIDGVARIDGIEGWGYSTIDLQNLTPDVSHVAVALMLRERGGVTLRRTLAGLAGGSIALGHEQSMLEGFWHGSFQSDSEAVALVRTTWPLSATSVYEGIAPSKEWLLPLIIRGLDEQYSIYFVQNASDKVATVTYQWFDPDTGGIESEWADEVGPGEVVNLDALEFATPLSRLPANKGSGFIGGIRIRSNQDVAVMVYNNEAFAGGVSAYVARPRGEAAISHALPVIRSNYLGDSLIAVANAGDEKVDVTITYRGDPASPSGADATIVDTFSVGPRGAKNVDLSGRGWSTAPATHVGRGGGANTGFMGSAIVTSSGPIAVTVLETAIYPAAVRASASYNGFTPAELGSAFAVPALRHVPGGRTTRLVFQNPGATAVSVETTLFDGATEVRRETTVVPAGSAGSIATAGDVTATLSARIVASGPIAALVYESPWDAPSEWGPSGDLGYDTAAYAAPRASGAEFPTPRPPTITPTPMSSSTPSPTPSPTLDPMATGTPISDPQTPLYVPFASR